jgi:hypothetical protein
MRELHYGGSSCSQVDKLLGNLRFSVLLQSRYYGPIVLSLRDFPAEFNF